MNQWNRWYLTHILYDGSSITNRSGISEATTYREFQHPFSSKNTNPPLSFRSRCISITVRLKLQDLASSKHDVKCFCKTNWKRAVFTSFSGSSSYISGLNIPDVLDRSFLMFSWSGFPPRGGIELCTHLIMLLIIEKPPLVFARCAMREMRSWLNCHGKSVYGPVVIHTINAWTKIHTEWTSQWMPAMKASHSWSPLNCIARRQCP